MFTLVLGKPGAGKTAFLVYLLYRYIQQGALCATSLPLTKNFPYYNRVFLLGEWYRGNEHFKSNYPVFEICPSDTPGAHRADTRGTYYYRAFWHYLSRGVPWKIFVPELDNYFDAEAYRMIPQDVRGYFKQHRHWSHDIIADCQVVDHLWTRIRRMAQRYIYCENTGRTERLFSSWLPVSWSSFLHSEFISQEMTPEMLSGTGAIDYPTMARVFTWYHTDASVPVVEYPVGGAT